MPRNKKPHRLPLEKRETIVETEYRLKQEAREISKKFIHTKPVKYLIK
jgi:hypothetical protein